MRRSPVIALALSAVALMAGTAQADVTDVVVTTALPGLLTITGAGSLPTGPLGASTSTTIGNGSSAIAGSTLTVQDATGKTVGWSVNAKYVALDTPSLGALPLPTGVVAAANIGGDNVLVTPATGLLGTTNSTLGVADSGLGFSAGALGTGAGRTILSTTGDGRGVTAFSTSYTLNLPAKSAATATLYTGSVLYTVSPNPA